MYASIVFVCTKRGCSVTKKECNLFYIIRWITETYHALYTKLHTYIIYDAVCLRNYAKKYPREKIKGLANHMRLMNMCEQFSLKVENNGRLENTYTHTTYKQTLSNEYSRTHIYKIQTTKTHIQEHIHMNCPVCCIYVRHLLSSATFTHGESKICSINIYNGILRACAESRIVRTDS